MVGTPPSRTVKKKTQLHPASRSHGPMLFPVAWRRGPDSTGWGAPVSRPIPGRPRSLRLTLGTCPCSSCAAPPSKARVAGKTGHGIPVLAAGRQAQSGVGLLMRQPQTTHEAGRLGSGEEATAGIAVPAESRVDEGGKECGTSLREVEPPSLRIPVGCDEAWWDLGCWLLTGRPHKRSRTQGESTPCSLLLTN